MNIVLFEDEHFADLLPLTWLRACFELRCGRDRLIDKVRAHLGTRIVRLMIREELHEVVEDRTRLDEPDPRQDWCLINARTLVTGNVQLPAPKVAWVNQGTLIAATVSADVINGLDESIFRDPSRLNSWVGKLDADPPPGVVRMIARPWDLIGANSGELERQCGQGGEHAGRIHAGAHLLNPSQIHVASGAVIQPGVVLDAESGPIHIDRNVVVQPNAVIEGPCFVGRDSIVRPGTVLRDGTTIGPVCKVGGEIEASIFQGYGNKQHDGFLGHSFIASWVNLGADTVTSNLKNTYGSIRVSMNGVGVETGQHFLGSFVADHVKTGIGTILPTGCVIGVAANIFTNKHVPKFVPSFAWLTDEGLTRYRIDKALRIARIVTARRDVFLSDAEATLIELTAMRAADIEAAGWA